MKHIKKFVFPFLLLLIAVFLKYFIQKYELTRYEYFETFNMLGSILLIVSLV